MMMMIIIIINTYINRVIPVITEATRTISESFRQYLRDKLGKHEIKEIQKTAILGTEHILQKVLR